jgi:hypothetical protein
MAHGWRCSQATSSRCRCSCEGKRHGEANVQVGATQRTTEQPELPDVATVIARVRAFAESLGAPLEVWAREPRGTRGRWTQLEGEG